MFPSVALEQGTPFDDMASEKQNIYKWIPSSPAKNRAHLTAWMREVMPTAKQTKNNLRADCCQVPKVRWARSVQEVVQPILGRCLDLWMTVHKQNLRRGALRVTN
jgi:hypothetical protein